MPKAFALRYEVGRFAPFEVWGVSPFGSSAPPPLRASDASPQRLAYSKKWRKYSCMGEVVSDIFDYIEAFYNRRRLHSTLGCLSQVEYRLKRLAV
ncbi:IS3 family transposase [Fibrobacter sp. HC4]|uniref:IS3 family transposase n=1 Tax=Fibrobacter sp. HC4 TaxID=3239812 RepID=UPI0035BCC084|nr:hypothetical protein [Fibrobacter succinogenes]